MPKTATRRGAPRKLPENCIGVSLQLKPKHERYAQRIVRALQKGEEGKVSRADAIRAVLDWAEKQGYKGKD